MLVRDAIEITGGLSSPSKMPGWAWGIPAKYCQRGSKLRLKTGTTCSDCYACKGRYTFGAVQNAYERRWNKYLAATREAWVGAMVADIGAKATRKPYFRWLDSGDVQSPEMLLRIFEVCDALTNVRFWMSTRERGIVKLVLASRPQPLNLALRVSADMLDGPPPEGLPNTSTVHVCPSHVEWQALVNSNGTSDTYHCPAPLQNGVCGSCRACWDPEVKNVCYRRH
jgi:hypothetical protein